MSLSNATATWSSIPMEREQWSVYLLYCTDLARNSWRWLLRTDPARQSMVPTPPLRRVSTGSLRQRFCGNQLLGGVFYCGYELITVQLICHLHLESGGSDGNSHIPASASPTLSRWCRGRDEY